MELAAAVRVLRCKSFERLISLTKWIRYEVAFKAIQLRVSKRNASDSDSMYHSGDHMSTLNRFFAFLTHRLMGHLPPPTHTARKKEASRRRWADENENGPAPHSAHVKTSKGKFTFCARSRGLCTAAAACDCDLAAAHKHNGLRASSHTAPL